MIRRPALTVSARDSPGRTFTRSGGALTAVVLRLLDASWRTLQRDPRLLGIAATATAVEADHLRHQPVVDHLDRLLTRGRRSGELTDDVPTSWLATAVVTLGHAAGDAVNAGRMALPDATEALARSVLRVCGVGPATIADLVWGAESRT